MSAVSIFQFAATAGAFAGAAIILCEITARWIAQRRYERRRREVHESFQRWKKQKHHDVRPPRADPKEHHQ